MKNQSSTVFSLLLGALLVFGPVNGRSEDAPAGPGLSLGQAVATVLERSPLSEAAEAGLAAAEQGRLSARGEFLPKLKTRMDYTLLDEAPMVELPLVLPGSGARGFPAGEDKTLASRTTLEQPVFTGLALLSQYRLADLERQEAEISRRDTLQGLILETHEAYYGVLTAEKVLGVADQAVAQLESHAEVARQFFDNGMIPKNDLLKSLVSLADTRRRRIEAAHGLELAWARLYTLLRMNQDREPLRLTQELAWSLYDKSLEECTTLALSHHPGVLLTRLAVDRADKGVTLARSGYFPKIALVGALDHQQGGFVETEHQLSATVHADWTVWEWGSNHYKVQQSKSRMLMARARHTQEVDTVKLRVRASYLELKEWQESIEVAGTSIEQAEENYRITVEQYRENVTTSTEVLDAQTLQAQAKVNYFTALSNYHIARARLEKAMGILQSPES